MVFVWRTGPLTHGICVENWTADPWYLCGELKRANITLFVWRTEESTHTLFVWRTGELTHNVICVDNCGTTHP